MTYARLCEHGEVKAHPVTKVRPHLTGEGIGDWVIPRSTCLGGSVLADDSVVIEEPDAFVGEFGLMLLRKGIVSPESASTQLLNMFDALASAQGSQE